MIYEKDLDEAIAECQGKRNPDASTCIKLAAFYAIKRELYGRPAEYQPSYSYAPAPSSKIEINSESEFSKLIDGKSQQDIWPILDELMDTLKVLMPRLYDGVMRKLY